MDFEFDDLKREFLAEAEGKIAEIRSMVSDGFPPPADHLDRMIYLAHQLKGAGGSYGFASISTESAELETQLEGVKTSADASIGDDVRARIDRIAAVIAEKTRELAPQS